MSAPQPPWGPQGPDPRDWRAAPPPPGGPAWDQLFELDDVRRPLPGQRDGGGRPKAVLGAIALIMVVVIAAVVGWLATRDGTETASTPTSSVDPTDAAAQSRLLSQLPTGYPQGVCESKGPADGGLAVVSCKQNADPGGPASATFTLVRDKAALEVAMNTVITGSTAVECPGRIQSPVLCPTGVSRTFWEVRR